MWRYIKTGTYPHRFSHPEPAVAPATDTDIGPLLSAPRSHTDSWPYHKCERLMGKRETRHTLTHWCHWGVQREKSLCHSHLHFFFTHTDTHKNTCALLFLQPLYNSQATRLPFLILASLTLGCCQRHSTHSAIIRLLCCAVAMCSHLSSSNLSPAHFYPLLQPKIDNPSPPPRYQSNSVRHEGCWDVPGRSRTSKNNNVMKQIFLSLSW